jgi:hypothetical protein
MVDRRRRQGDRPVRTPWHRPRIRACGFGIGHSPTRNRSGSPGHPLGPCTHRHLRGPFGRRRGRQAMVARVGYRRAGHAGWGHSRRDATGGRKSRVIGCHDPIRLAREPATFVDRRRTQKLTSNPGRASSGSRRRIPTPMHSEGRPGDPSTHAHWLDIRSGWIDRRARELRAEVDYCQPKQSWSRSDSLDREAPGRVSLSLRPSPVSVRMSTSRWILHS